MPERPLRAVCQLDQPPAEDRRRRRDAHPERWHCDAWLGQGRLLPYGDYGSTPTTTWIFTGRHRPCPRGTARAGPESSVLRRQS